MPATTKNRKILDKEFLEDSIYLYDKNYTHKKQNIIDNQSPHINLESKDEKDLTKAKLNINISNDSERKDYDYLIANNDEKNTLKWISPVYPDDKELLSTEELNEYDKKLISAKALNNFKGTGNINIVGEIADGTWNAGSIEAHGNIKAHGNISAKKAIIENFTTTSTGADNIKALNIKVDTLNVEKNADFKGKITVVDDIASTATVSGDTGKFATGAISNLTVYETIKAAQTTDKNEKTDYNFKLDSTILEAKTSNINLTGLTTIKNGKSIIEVNNNKTDIASTSVNITGSTTIKNNDNASIVVKEDNTITGKTYINNILTIDDEVTAKEKFKVVDKSETSILEVDSKEASINTSNIKLGSYLIINNNNVSISLPLALESGTIVFSENEFIFDTSPIVMEESDFDFSFFED